MTIRTFISIIVLSALSTAFSSASQPIRTASYPALSPDGSSILFSWKGDIWRASSEGGQAARLTTHPAWDFAPQYSPDGTSICFGSTRAGGYQVFEMSADGGNARQITFHSEGSFLQDIAPNGKSILVRGPRDFPGRRPDRLYQVNLDAKSPEKIAFNAYAQNGKFSPDGKSILFTREGVETYRKGYRGTMSSQVWRWNSDGFSQTATNDHGCRTPFYYPGDKGESKGFFFTQGSPNGFNLWFHDNASDTQRQVTHFTDDSVLQPAIARNGSTIIFRHLFDLYVMPLTQADQTTIAPQKLTLFHDEDLDEKTDQEMVISKTSDISFSPSGLEIVFTAEGDLWAMDTILKNPHRLTTTAGHEKDVWFSHDGKSILYIYDNGIDTEIRRLKKSKSIQFWWEAEDCKHTVVVKATDRPINIYPDPKGKKIAYTTYPGNLWISKPDGSEPIRMLESWDTPSVQWSPDGKWLAYTAQDNDFNPDIYLTPADGSSPPINISQHPDIDHSPVWSPDGRRLAFVGRHHKEEYDIFYLDLYKSDEVKDKDGETRELAQKAMAKDPAYKKESVKKTVKKAIKTLTEDKKKKEPEAFDLENTHQRIRRIKLKGISPKSLIWKSDSKSILFQSSSSQSSSRKSSKVTYTVEAKSGGTPKKIADATGSPVRMDSKGKLYWISDGVPAVLAEGKNTKYPFTIYTHRDLTEWKRMIFRTVWNTMRDSFYDPAMNHRDWNAIRNKYETMATEAPNSMIFDRIVSMMLGELNASHTGFITTTAWPKDWVSPKRWKEETVHLGVKFDNNHSGKGWKVKSVIPKSPADRTISKIKAGETITQVEGEVIKANTPITQLLNRRSAEPVDLTVANKEGKERQVKIQPAIYSAIRVLTENANIDASADAVDKLSGGKLGYIHVARMMWDEFEKFEHHLYEQGAGKDGIVIDVRNNGGGFTTDHLLTALCQPRHAYTIPRNGGIGYPQDRIVYATWNKPIIVLCNQNSFSNAEIFAHAIRNLKRGKVVGVASAGGVISTGRTTILSTATMRLPFRGWFTSMDGKDMELNGAQPHVTLWNKPGELSQGKDVQLEKAVQILLEDSSKASGFPKAHYRSAK